jgi:Ca2+-binding RTX toxin-like protein
MAYIKGLFIDLPDTLGPYGVEDNYYDDFDDNLVGTSGADTIEGLGGNDHIWGAMGDDVMYGGEGNDVIKPTHPDVDIVADWGYDEAHGGGGSDILDFRKTTHHVALHGDGGIDFIYGGSAGDYLDGGSQDDFIRGNGGGDTIQGGSGHDTVYAGDGDDFISGGKDSDHLFGDDGNDTIWGEDGDDYLYGQNGNDILSGDAGQDELWGGAGRDEFQFNMQDSDPAKPDDITDFQPKGWWPGTAYDTIRDVSGPGGTASNYLGTSIGYGAGYDAAKNFAASNIGGAIRYVFVTDGVDGYFFSDSFGNGTIDNGIILDGLSSLSDFSYINILG